MTPADCQRSSTEGYTVVYINMPCVRFIFKLFSGMSKTGEAEPFVPSQDQKDAANNIWQV